MAGEVAFMRNNLLIFFAFVRVDNQKKIQIEGAGFSEKLDF